MFIVFEGLDGSGKSTQARLLAGKLRAEGRDVVLTREPGGTPAAEEIRGLILSGKDRFSDMCEVMLFNAARADHVEKLILPSLERGAVVISDRYALSTFAYQGMRSERMRDAAMAIHEVAIGLNPDVTLVLESADPSEMLRRRAAEGGETNRLDERSLKFAAEMSRELESGAAWFAERGCRVVRIGPGDVTEVSEAIGEALADLMHRAPENDTHTP